MGQFLLSAADHVDSIGDKYDHEHLSDVFPEFHSAPHFLVAPSRERQGKT